MEIRLHASWCMPHGACVVNRRFKKRHSDDRFRKPTFFDARKRRLRVDERLKRRKKIFVSKISGHVLS